MLYFSELYGNAVFTRDKQLVGTLQDLLFLPSETPLITKFVIKTPDKYTVTIPDEYVKKSIGGFDVSNAYKTEEKNDKEISLLYRLQNQQITDIDGAKIIRVNDVIISDAPDFIISGIDVGVLGVFRWVGASKLLSSLLDQFNIHYKSDFIPWSEIEPDQLVDGRIVLRSERERLKRIRPEDLAEHLEHGTIRNVLRSLKVMDEKLSARVIADLNVDYQREIFVRFSAEHAAQVLSLIDPDEAVDVLLSLEQDRREEILSFIERGKKGPILHLLRHAKTPIGHLMSTEYITVSSDMSAMRTLQKVKHETKDFSDLHYIYALNDAGQVVGVVSMHELLTQSSDVRLYRIMNQNLVLARLTTPLEILLRRMLKYGLSSIPIVDDERKMLGIVSLQDVAKTIVERMDE